MKPLLGRYVSPEALYALTVAEEVIRRLPDPPDGETWFPEELATVVADYIDGAEVVGGTREGRLHAWVSVPNGAGRRCILDPQTDYRLPSVQLVGPGCPAYVQERHGSWRPPREPVVALLCQALRDGGMTRKSYSPELGTGYLEGATVSHATATR